MYKFHIVRENLLTLRAGERFGETVASEKKRTILETETTLFTLVVEWKSNREI